MVPNHSGRSHQTAKRGERVRMRVRRESELEEMIETVMKERRTAAVKIQRFYRKREKEFQNAVHGLTEVFMLEREFACRKIQKVYRGYRTRVVVDHDDHLWVINTKCFKGGDVVQMDE
eukprot:GHVN01083875.1.p1 GENE.GHVN01083875.1~~GHVN01083875.1.p1  ORF type:complete len:118 (-),score=25.09 GHVN01083875.1:109-462(-)